MKNSLKPMTVYLMFGKKFRNEITPRTVKYYIRQYGRNFNSSLYSQKTGTTIYSKSAIDNNKKIDYCIKKYCTSPSKPSNLMDFPIAMYPSAFHTLKMMFLTYFTLQKFEEDFIMSEFVENTKAVLRIITTLLSEMRFSELEELLTNDCKKQVERNVRCMEPAQRYGLAVKEEEIYYSLPYTLDIIKDGVNNERTFAQITVIYHICRNFAEVIQKPTMQRIYESTIDMFTVYNCRFIKEVTKGVNDQWTINAINVYKMHEDPTYKKREIN